MDDRYDRWLDDRAMFFADGSSEDPEPEPEPDQLDEYRTTCSRALHELAEAMRAHERDARARRDHTVANAMNNRADAYQHAAAIVSRLGR